MAAWEGDVARVKSLVGKKDNIDIKDGDGVSTYCRIELLGAVLNGITVK